ncbi:MAG TPA: cyclase family protein [Trebonia sp.]|jgi:kynurenine formamidase|nr:cyclase family protein [Trebonia sp.]
MTVSAPGTTAALLAAAARTRTVELGHPLFTGMPSTPNHPGFRMTLIRRHGDVVRPGGSSASNDIIVTGGHVGTHVDALAHISQDGELHGGLDAHTGQLGGRHASLGAEHIPAMITRAVLLDVAGLLNVDRLAPERPATAVDLAAAADRAGVLPRPGDVALVRTGWARLFPDAEAYLGHRTGVPGVAEDGARWLADLGVIAVGADTPAFEPLPADDGAAPGPLPVHRLLLVERGVHIIEHLTLEEAAAQGLTEFLFVLAPLRVVGGTAGPARPVAVVAE